MTQWQNFPQMLDCPPETVHLIGISLSHTVYNDQLLCLLSSEEKQRSMQFKFEIHQRRYVMFHAFLRHVLGAYTDIKPEMLEFEYGFNQKPSLKNQPELHFNLSHSEDEGIVAISSGAAIGVDIEKMKVRHMSALAERFFSPHEVGYLQSLTATEQHSAFYHLWTHKEAFIKATGFGLSQDLKRFAVGLNPSRLTHADEFNLIDWTLQSFAWREGYSSAFAVNQSVQSVHFFQYHDASFIPDK